jgi:hypothetical protein
MEKRTDGPFYDILHFWGLKHIYEQIFGQLTPTQRGGRTSRV